MNRTPIAAAIFASSTLLAACGGDSSGDSGQAAIDFYNELTDSQALLKSAVEVDLLENSDTTALLSKQSYSTKSAGGTATVSLSGGQVSFTAENTSNQNAIVQSAANSMQDGGTYTTVLMGDLKAGQTLIQSYQQRTGTVASGKVSIRFINALSLLNPNTVDLQTSGGTSIATGLVYSGASDYQTLSPLFGFLSIDVMQNGSTLASPTCKVTAGNTYDAILAYTSYKGSTIGLYCHELS